jgi:dipeptidyl aminopeptidase/acylaminoacyl peptidase
MLRPSLFALAAALACAPMSVAQLLPGAQPEKQPTPVPVASPDKRPAIDLSKGVPLIPRAILFGNPDKAQARVSPDGKHIAYLAPVNGVLNIWVGPAADLSAAKPVTSDDRRGIRQFNWAYTSKHVLFTQDKGGDENWRIYSADIDTKEIKDLTPMDGVAAQIQNVSEKFPDEIIVGINDRNPAYHDLYKLNIRTGAKTLLIKNEIVEKSENGKDKSSGYAQFTTDDDFNVRFATKPNKDGSISVLKAVENGKSGFQPYDSIPLEDADTTNIVGFDATGNTAYVIDARGRNTAGLYTMDVATKAKKIVFEDDQSDVQGVMINPITKKLEAVKTNFDREQWAYIDPALQADFLAMRLQGGPGEWNVTSRSQDDRYWTVTFVEADAPAKTCLLDRGDVKSAGRQPKLTTLFVSSKQLADQPLTKMYANVIKSRDGLDLVSYLSLPLDSDQNGKASNPLPMVLLVHGGPWARDNWGYNPYAQWLANRGYAVLQPNFRGSTGVGKKHLNAGNMEWAGKMHDDLIDCVNWAVAQKIADPKKIAIMGGSYGGYATLVGLAFTPDVFACGVDIVGPSNLNTLLGSIPAYWEPEIDLMTKRVGDFRTDEGRKFLDSRSPLTRADKITKPLLIGQGANDPRVKQAEADQIVAAMTGRKIPVTYVLYPDEGHGFARPANRISFNAVTEQSLAKHLGGRAEPIGDAMKGSTIQVPAGADGVPGLSEALASMPKTEEPRKDATPKQ